MEYSSRQQRDSRPLFLGFTFASMMLVQVLGEGQQLYIQLSAIVVLVVSFIIVLSYRPTNTIPPMALTFTLLFALIITLGAFKSADILGARVFARAFGVLAFLFLGLMLSQRREHAILERAFPIYAFFLLFVLLYVLFDNDRLFARLRGYLHPNLWAFIAGTSLVGILYLKSSITARALLLGIFFYFLAFEFQARGPLLYSSLIVFFVALIYSVRMIGYSKNSTFLLALFSGLATIGILSILLTGRFILDDILLISHENRGLGSGFTGRTEIWAALFSILSEKPLLGHGLDMSRYYVTNFISDDLGSGDAQSSHNSYITMLFDFGVIGFSIYFCFLILMFIGAIRTRKFQFLAFLTIYSLMGFTEARPLNVGNPPSLFFVILMPYLAACVGQARSIPRHPNKSPIYPTHRKPLTSSL